MEMSEATMQEAVKIFSQLPYEQWEDHVQQLSMAYPELQPYASLPSYSLLILLMEYSFSHIVDRIEPIVAKQGVEASQKLFLLCKAFIDFALHEPDAYRIAFLVRPIGNSHDHVPVESAIGFRVSIRKVFRLLSQEQASTKDISLELQVQGLMCVLNGIVVSSLFLQRMDLIEIESLSNYVITQYLSGISQ